MKISTSVFDFCGVVVWTEIPRVVAGKALNIGKSWKIEMVSGGEIYVKM